MLTHRTFIQFDACPGKFYELLSETEAAWEATLRAANLWAPGEYWPDFTQYETSLTEEVDLYICGQPCVELGAGGGHNSGCMGD